MSRVTCCVISLSAWAIGPYSPAWPSSCPCQHCCHLATWTRKCQKAPEVSIGVEALVGSGSLRGSQTFPPGTPPRAANPAGRARASVPRGVHLAFHVGFSSGPGSCCSVPLPLVGPRGSLPVSLVSCAQNFAPTPSVDSGILWRESAERSKLGLFLEVKITRAQLVQRRKTESRPSVVSEVRAVRQACRTTTCWLPRPTLSLRARDKGPETHPSLFHSGFSWPALHTKLERAPAFVHDLR